MEDAQITRWAVCKILQQEGHETLEACNGAEGLTIIAKHSPDCIILDLLMPERSGWDVIEILRRQGSTIPVIVITADIQETTRKRCLELGAIAVLQKFPKAAEVTAAIQTALGTKGKGTQE